MVSDFNGIWRSLIGQTNIARPRPAAPTIRHDKMGISGAEAFCFTPPKDPWYGYVKVVFFFLVFTLLASNALILGHVLVSNINVGRNIIVRRSGS